MSVVFALYIAIAGQDVNNLDDWETIYVDVFSTKQECVDGYSKFYHVHNSVLTAHIDKGMIVQAGCFEVESDRS